MNSQLINKIGSINNGPFHFVPWLIFHGYTGIWLEHANPSQPNLPYVQIWQKYASENGGWLKEIDLYSYYPPLIDEDKKEVRILVGWPTQGTVRKEEKGGEENK